MRIVISEEELSLAVEDHLGWCTVCKEFTHDTCEPDASEYECPVCFQRTVYGAENALIMGFIDFEP